MPSTTTLYIIVPIYDVEAYLAECLQSIANQQIQNLHAILVDDGSKDGSAAIAQSFCDKYSHFTLIRQENKGLPGARNTGIHYVTNLYKKHEGGGGSDVFIGFVDSDDVIAPDYFKHLLEAAHKHKAKIAKSSSIVIFDDSSYKSATFTRTSPALSLKRPISSAKDVSKIEVWRSIYALELFSKVLFDEELLACEDVAFSHCMHALVDHIALVFGAKYFYRQRQGSIMKTSRFENAPQKAFLSTYRFLKGQNLLAFGLPSGIFRPHIPGFGMDSHTFTSLRELILSLNLPQDVIAQDPILHPLIHAHDVRDFLAQTSSFGERLRRYFRFRISKKQCVIVLFGITLWQTKRL